MAQGLSPDLGSMPSSVALLQARVPTTASAANHRAAATIQTMLSLLSQSPQPKDAGSEHWRRSYTIPKKLSERIWRWEFIQMGDLLLENWVVKVEDGATNPLGVVGRKCQITDVHT